MGAAKKASDGAYKRLSPAAGCGHKTVKEGNVTAFGETAILEAPLDAKGKPYICLSCLGKLAIQCSYCGRPIFPGDGITLYSLGCEFPVNERTVVFGFNPQKLVGCMRPTCVSDAKGYSGGVWVPNVVQKTAYVGEVFDDVQIFTGLVKASRYYRPLFDWDKRK